MWLFRKKEIKQELVCFKKKILELEHCLLSERNHTSYLTLEIKMIYKRLEKLELFEHTYFKEIILEYYKKFKEEKDESL